MKNLLKLSSIVFISLCLTVGCATSKVTERQQLVSGKLPRPGNI